MTKREMIEIVAKRAHLTKRATKEGIEALLAEISRALKRGEKVILSGFGTFKITKVKDKKGRNPKTGETLMIKGHRSVRFIVSKTLKREVK